LLGRGFLLSQVIERWQARAIWVVSRADAEYPRRLKVRLREDAPAVIYGCGDMALLESGGLAVVGSRHVDDSLIDYTMAVGRLAARAGRTLVSGGAKGIDQAAMRGALEAGGKVSGVLADSLEKTTMNREHRNLLLDGQLVLISPYDPKCGFNVGNAMQRNKLIYALADASLVVSSDLNRGGTWAGAIEQLDKLKFVPVYVRSTGESSAGLDALRKQRGTSLAEPARRRRVRRRCLMSTHAHSRRHRPSRASRYFLTETGRPMSAPTTPVRPRRQSLCLKLRKNSCRQRDVAPETRPIAPVVDALAPVQFMQSPSLKPTVQLGVGDSIQHQRTLCLQRSGK
jgi:predicted Rossmann fold nucleotide-binding protein DprA/Smf involved in DNA uptake